uniref:Transmembrane and TPR repeat-containing protein 4 n=2 Tax=Planktothrix TaxID=54304 RepID=A0A9W4CU88_9CYAN|nr:Transmembrane and TPR repeat-containing protein 4 [Planktothrix pseudagardhii]
MILMGIITLTGVMAYSNIFNSFFLSDDFVLIALLSKLGPLGLWMNQQHGQSLFFRPLLGLISFLDYQIWGLNAFGYHLTNFGFHLGNSFLVGRITYLLSLNLRLELKLKRFIPYFAGFIFLLLPSHSEAVSWISARTDVIATFFALLSFSTYLTFKQFYQPLQLWISLAAFLAALLCKESIVSFPGLILAYELYQYLQEKPRTLNKLLTIVSFYVIFLGFYFVCRYLKLGTFIGGYGKGIHLQFNPIQILYNLIIYPPRSFLPPQFNASSFTVWIIDFIGIILISLLVFLLSYYKHQLNSQIPQTLILLIVGFWICVLPAINVSVSPFDTQGERYLYWASSFTSIYIALVITILVSNFQLTLILSSIILVSLGLSLHSINQNWKFAGELSQSLLSSLQKIPIESPIITSVPDNYRGAYVYRTGLIQGLYLFDPENRFNVQFEQKPTDKPFEKVRFYTDNILLVMMNTLLEPTDKILVNSPQLNQYQFQLSNPQTTFFLTPKNTVVTQDYHINNVQPQSYTLNLNNPSRFQDLLLYSSGQFVKLSN